MHFCSGIWQPHMAICHLPECKTCLPYARNTKNWLPFASMVYLSNIGNWHVEEQSVNTLQWLWHLAICHSAICQNAICGCHMSEMKNWLSLASMVYLSNIGDWRVDQQIVNNLRRYGIWQSAILPFARVQYMAAICQKCICNILI